MRDFSRPLHWFPVVTDQIVRQSLKWIGAFNVWATVPDMSLYVARGLEENEVERIGELYIRMSAYKSI